MGKAKVIALALTGLAATGLAGSLMSDNSKPASSISNPVEAPVVREFVEETPLQSGSVQQLVDEKPELPKQKSEPLVQPAVAPKPAPKPVPKPTPAPKPAAPACSCPAADLDCADFSSCSEAQAVYRCCLSQGKGDRHDLDRDGDGTACDTLCR